MTSKFLRHIACEHCGSTDGNSLYDDGHTHCFVCNKTEFENQIEERTVMRDAIAPTKKLEIRGQIKSIPERGISQATCDKFGVTQSEGHDYYKPAHKYDPTPHHYYPYSDKEGKVVAYKVRRTTDKSFSIMGDFKEAVLFGQHLFHGGGKYVTVYEGELDALAGYQLTGSQWPSVSIRNGAQAALKDCKAQYEWLNSFESIVICFDADEPGQKASKEVAELFGQKAKIVKHKSGYKDACEYLQAGATKEFVNEWWKAETYIPDGIVNAADLWEEVRKPEPLPSALYPWQGLNKLLYGFRPAELITVTAGSGLGKSQFLREILYHLLKTTDWKIGGLFLEESTKKTALSIMSLAANRLLHIPKVSFSRKDQLEIKEEVTEQELKEAFDATLGTNRVYLFDHFGSSDVDNIANRIRYMAKACDCRVIFLDHISIVVSGQDVGDERKAIDNMMTKLRTLVQELEVTLICVSHLRRPQGNAGHEDGQAVSLSQLRGSGAIAQLSDAVITLERNSMAENEAERHKTKVAVAKNRFSGLTGPACDLQYVKETGRMIEMEMEVL